MKVIIRLFLALLVSLFFLLLIILGCTYYSNKTGQVFYIFKYTSFVVSGSSMNPNIKAGDLLIIKKMDNYLLNDIVVYKNDEGITICHRIINADNEMYQTKGDNNNYSDGYMPKNEDIYGKVIKNVFNIEGIFQNRYQIMGGFALLFVILLVMKRGQNVR